MHQDKTIWTRFAIMMLGLWMIAMPLTFPNHSFEMRVSDFVSGALLVFFGGYAVASKRQSILWFLCLVGVWLQFAPLVFWAPDSVSYVNDTIVGILVIALSILIPENPIEDRVKGASIPPGWSYNPSAWLQRMPIIFFGFFAWMFARYMASFELGYLDTIWDPIFGNGTERVVTSRISKDFPVPDAGLGAMAYTIEVLMGAHGSSRRWHTIPWFVLLFAILVIPLGFVSIVLIILQPIIVKAWCTWCLLTAVCMLIMITLAVDEVVAVFQYLSHVRREGKSVWHVLWFGGDVEGSMEDSRSPSVDASVTSSFPAMTWGVGIPLNLVVTALLGGWLMFSPHVLNIKGPSADSGHIIGALTVAVSIISMAEVVRAGRFIVTLFGFWVFLSAWVLPGNISHGIIDHVVVGILMILFSLRRGPIKEKYGDWDHLIK